MYVHMLYEVYGRISCLQFYFHHNLNFFSLLVKKSLGTLSDVTLFFGGKFPRRTFL